jgi:hypothetical protein
MSRAFVKESEDAASELDLPERSVSPHRNLVTPAGLEQIEAEVRRSGEELSTVRPADYAQPMTRPASRAASATCATGISGARARSSCRRRPATTRCASARP